MRRTTRYQYRRRKKRSQFLLKAGIPVLAVVLVIVTVLIIKGGKKIPSGSSDVSSISSSVTVSSISSEPVSSEIVSGPTSSELEEQRLFQERYDRAKNVLLANFTHPNYKDPDDLVYLKDVLGKKYKINASYFQLSHDTAYALKEMLDAALATVEHIEDEFVTTVKKISVEMIGENEESIIVIEKMLGDT